MLRPEPISGGSLFNEVEDSRVEHEFENGQNRRPFAWHIQIDVVVNGAREDEAKPTNIIGSARSVQQAMP